MTGTSVVVAVPTTGGTVRQKTCLSLFRLGAHLGQRSIATRIIGIDGSNVVEGRDSLAMAFLKSSATHLLFVDSDMEFLPAAFDLLLSSGKDIVAAAYTQKHIDFERMKQTLKSGQSFEEAYVAAHKFTLRGNWRADGNLLEVDEAGIGFMLIHRRALNVLVEGGQLRKYSYMGAEQLGFFDRSMDEDTLLSEDLSFCRRWRAAGGNIWIHTECDVRHIGEMSFGFPISKLLKQSPPA